MIRCCAAIAVGAVLGAVVALGGGLLILRYGGDTILSW